MRDVLGGFHDACADAVARFGGYVYQLVGDGVVACLGWPRAHENDAERSISAGLEIVETISGRVRASGDPTGLACRVGIASGHVVVEGDAQTGSANTISGEAPKLAARLQAIAGPDQVVISVEVHDLAGSRFECTDLGAHPTKGFEGPVPAWRVLARRTGETRFEATRGRLTQLVGREAKLAACRERWESARRSAGQVVSVGSSSPLILVG